MKLTQDGQDSYLLSTDLVKSPLPNILYSGMNMDCQSFFFSLSLSSGAVLTSSLHLRPFHWTVVEFFYKIFFYLMHALESYYFFFRSLNKKY